MGRVGLWWSARRAIVLAAVGLPVLAGCAGERAPAAPEDRVTALRIEVPVREPVWSEGELLALSAGTGQVARIEPYPPASGAPLAARPPTPGGLPACRPATGRRVRHVRRRAGAPARDLARDVVAWRHDGAGAWQRCRPAGNSTPTSWRRAAPRWTPTRPQC